MAGVGAALGVHERREVAEREFASTRCSPHVASGTACSVGAPFCAVISSTSVVGVDEHSARGRFQVCELRHPSKRELDFFRRENVKQNDLVLPMAKMLERDEQPFDVVETIGQDYDQSTASDLV